MLTKHQFNILVCLEAEDKPLSQRQIANKISASIGTVNRALQQLSELGYVHDGSITEEGLKALEPYRVKRAIFMAAGFGSRMLPITLNTPKPLVRVGGVRLIDTLIDACLAAEIEEIIVIRGYLGDQFDQLLYKYPMIKFIENPDFDSANNIVSMLYAREFLGSSYVLEADLYLRNPALITKYQYSSNYLGIPVRRTDDWCIYLKGGYIDKSVQGGEGDNCYQTVGISYWTPEDGARLREDVKKVCEMPGGKENLWGYVPLTACHSDYKVAIRPCAFEDVVEIDSFAELKQIDPSYSV
ncbi:MAG: winged helix-turn-helix transcriptional regulator [Ruminococcaceae bacterium]|nr:winged helix-turn-helix transcriptional regulator [Oscillospiraceae bacterium]